MKKIKMKSYVMLLFILILTSCKNQEKLEIRDAKELTRVNGKFYYLNEVPGYTGIVEQYDKEFPEKLIVKAKVKDGLLDGQIEGYDINGNLQYQQNYKEGILHGKTKGYNKNGKLTYERNFSMGNTEGLYRVYYENGQIKYEENYKENRVDGRSLSYLEDGTLEQERVYENGVLKEEYNYGEENEKVTYIFSVDRNQSNVLKKVN